MHAATVAALGPAPAATLFEYFVYFRYPLLAEPDIRRAVAPRHLRLVDIEAVRGDKRAALAAYASQVTRFFPWQTRPVLTEAVLDEHAGGPEWFVRAPPGLPTGQLFTRDSLRLRINLRWGPALVHWKKRFLG